MLSRMRCFVKHFLNFLLSFNAFFNFSRDSFNRIPLINQYVNTYFQKLFYFFYIRKKHAQPREKAERAH